FAETDGGPDRGEVVELLRVDPADLGRVEAVDEEPERRGRRLARVVPALEGADEQRALKLWALAPLDLVHCEDGTRTAVPANRVPPGPYGNNVARWVRHAPGKQRSAPRAGTTSRP